MGVLCCASCIENTIPYPVVELGITSVEGEGFSATIDASSRIVTLTLDEQSDMAAVEVTSVVLTEGATASQELTGVLDLRSPLEVVLSMYQDYYWTIKAVQPIERYFTIEGQIGQSEIDVASRTVRAYVAKGTDLSNLKVTSLKLGPKDVTTITPAIEDLTDFCSVRYVYLNYPTLKGDLERWQIYILETEVSVQITQADAWATVAWLYGEAGEGTTVGFRYRERGQTAWVDAPSPTIEGGTFRTKVSGLKQNTEYEFVAYSNDDTSAVVSRTTESVVPLVNGGFELWCTKNSIIYPYSDGGDPYWGTGNVGASIANETLTEGVADPRPGSSGSLSARLSSKFANVFGIGKFAAGNLFIGSYVKNDGTHGIVHFGRPFTARPTALKGWLKYNCGEVDRITTQPPGVTINKGDLDRGMIYIALGDWDPTVYGGSAESPVEVATRRIDETAFDINSEAVIAYGELPLDESVETWTEFTIPLDYRATDRIPTHIIIVCSGSRYGDYFTGSTKSVMWLDDFELVYE